MQERDENLDEKKNRTCYIRYMVHMVAQSGVVNVYFARIVTKRKTFLLLCLIRKSQIKFSSLEYVVCRCSVPVSVRAIAWLCLFGVSVSGIRLCVHCEWRITESR